METDKPVYNMQIVRRYKVLRAGSDKRVSATISVILNNFLIKNPDAIICYICDDSDKRAVCRYKVFYKWYQNCSLQPKKYMLNSCVVGVVYFGVIMLESNTEKEKVYDYFKQELGNIPDKEVQIHQRS